MSHVTMNVDEKKPEDQEKEIPPMDFLPDDSQNSPENSIAEEEAQVALELELQSLMAEVEEEDSQKIQQEEATENAAKEPKELNAKQQYALLTAELEKITNNEDKLKLVVEFMGSSLATKQGVPYFKGFWESRTLALQLFKENINPMLRADLWNKYIEYSKEARRLKEMLDEQSAFASEQIEIAIKAIESEQERMSESLPALQGCDFLQSSRTLAPKQDFYCNIQAKLQLLSAHASRITALRKELIHIEMRVRQKNKFFQRLSAAGDRTFPQRKEFIKELSQQFNGDVDDFAQRYFSTDEPQESIFFLREEIKALQAIARHLTLNTQSFTHTRLRLSECWEKLKLFDKERKKQRAESRVAYKENADALQAKVTEISTKIEAGEFQRDEAHEHLDRLVHEMRQTELSRDDIKLLRDQITPLRNSLLEKEKHEEQERARQQQERERLKKFRIQELRNEIEALLTDLESHDADQLIARRSDFVQRIAELTASKLEKQELERLLKPLKDAIVDKKENAALALSDDDRQALTQLKEVLQQRKERRQEIKKQLEVLRKNQGSSGLDFEQALNFNAQLDAEKERLEKVSEGIKEIEDKIARFVVS